MNTEFKTAQDLIKSRDGSALAGFNRKIFGSTYHEAFQYEAERYDQSLHAGWNAAEKMINEGKIFFVHNFHHTHSDCEGYSFQYGGFWVCNSCGRKSCDEEWWKIKVFMDGNAWCCIGIGFEDLQSSDNYTFADTRDEAISDYGDLMIAEKDKGPD